MSGKTPQDYALYDRYMDRSDSSLSQEENVESISDVSETDKLSSEITSVQNDLLKQFPNLSLISSTIEDTIIVVDEEGNETEASLKRRKEVLRKLKETYERDKSLKEKVQKVLPQFCDDIEEVLGEKFYLIYDTAKSALIKKCNYVLATPTYNYDDIGYDEDEYDVDLDEGYEDGDYFDDTYVPEDEMGDDEEESDFPDKSPFDLCLEISDELDTADFQKALILAKTYLKYQMELYQQRIGKGNALESDVSSFTKANNSSLENIRRYTAYLNMPKTFEPKNPVLVKNDEKEEKDGDEYTK